ncbi:MAG: sugar ABC transporter permease, partial [Rhodobacteraceae bacterium]|nr:sugar ABC transporter permease [Paracoccaceae bacterium]
MTSSRSAWIFAWALLAPAILYVLAIVAWPLVETFRLSFTDASLRRTYDYVGITNYAKIFNETFAGVIWRTFTWTFFSVSMKMIIGTFGAVLLNSAVPG